jgi:hypothetical protein
VTITRIHQSIEFVIEGRPPGPNESNRTRAAAARWRQRREWRSAAEKRATTAREAWEWAHGQLWTSLPVASILVTFLLPTKRRYDLDNLMATLKPLLDGIVDSKIIRDDSIYTLPHFYIEWEYRQGVTGTVFRISEPL